MQVLAAALPVATSVNALHDKSKHLTQEAKDYKAFVANFLHNYPLLSAKERIRQQPYRIDFIHHEAIALATALKENKSRAKAVTSLKRKYGLDIELVVNNDGRDLDNVLKLFIDCIAAFVGFNDNQIIKIVARKVVNYEITPYMYVVVYEEDINWHAGLLSEQARIQRELDHMYDEDYYYDKFKETEGCYAETNNAYGA